MSDGRRRLTLSDMEEGGANIRAVTPGITEARRRRLSLNDIEPQIEKKPIPFEEGSTLKVGPWETGVNISPTVARALAGAGKRFSDVALRAKQLARVPGTQQEIDESKIRDQPLMETTAGLLGYALPDIVATGMLGTTRTLPAAVRTGALTGAGQAAITPTTSEENDLQAIASGLLGGAVGGALGQGVGNAVGRAYNAASGLIPGRVRGWAGQRGFTLPRPRFTDPEHEQLFNLAKEKGVPVSIGDIDPLSGWHRAENVLENLPSGRTQLLKQQQEASKKVVSDLRQNFDAAPKGGEIAEGVKNRYKELTKTASDKFKVVKDIADNDPNITTISPVNTYQTAREAAAKNPDIFDDFKNKPFIRKVLGLEQDMGPQPGLILNPKTMKPFKYDQQLSFDEAQFVRKQLGAWQNKLNRQFEKGTLPAGLTGEDVGTAKRLFGAFEQDLDTWASQPQNAAVSQAWGDARQYFNNNVMPYRDPTRLESKSKLVRDIINDDVDVATLPAKLFSKDESNLVSDIMNLSDQKGQEAVKSSLIDRMTRDAAHPDLPGMSSEDLLRATNKHSNAGEAAFTPTETQEIQNARDIAKMSVRSNEIGQGREGLGERLPAYLMGGSGMLGVGGATYMGLGAFGKEDMTPSERLAWSMGVAPLTALLGARLANKYTSSNVGKLLHFAEPEIKRPIIGGLQRGISSGIMGAGEPTMEEYTDYALGHRPGP